MRESKMTDEELVLGLKNGSMSCFEELYERHKTKIYNYLRHMLPTSESAEDCAHDVFIHLYKKAAHFKPNTSFISWLYRMARNLAYDALRKMKVRQASSLDQPLGPEEASTLANFLSSPSMNAAQTVEMEDMARFVRAGIARLSPEDRQIIGLCGVQGLPHMEAGRIIGCSTDTVAVKLHRARRRLAKILKLDQEFEEGP